MTAHFRLFLLCLLSALTVTSCHFNSKPTLYVFAWSDLFKPNIIARFEEKFNCNVVIDTYDSNESMYAKLRLSAVHYDLIFPSNYYVEILQNQQMLQAIDPEKVPNIAHLDPNFFALTSPLPAVPFIISFSGLAYRKDKIDLLDPSWNIFGQTEWKGRMTMLNDCREAVGAALRFLGYSVNTRSPSEVAEAGEQLLLWRKNLAKFESEQYKHGLSSGEFLVAQGYSIDTMQVIADNPDVDFAFPKEGAIMSVDSIAIPAGAENIELAHAFINFLLDTAVALENMNFTNSIVPVLPAYELLDEKKRSNPILFPPPEALKNMELIQDLQEDIQPYYKVWDRVKSG